MGFDESQGEDFRLAGGGNASGLSGLMGEERGHRASPLDFSEAGAIDAYDDQVVAANKAALNNLRTSGNLGGGQLHNYQRCQRDMLDRYSVDVVEGWVMSDVSNIETCLDLSTERQSSVLGPNVVAHEVHANQAASSPPRYVYVLSGTTIQRRPSHDKWMMHRHGLAVRGSRGRFFVVGSNCYCMAAAWFGKVLRRLLHIGRCSWITPTGLVVSMMILSQLFDKYTCPHGMHHGMCPESFNHQCLLTGSEARGSSLAAHWRD